MIHSPLSGVAVERELAWPSYEDGLAADATRLTDAARASLAAFVLGRALAPAPVECSTALVGRLAGGLDWCAAWAARATPHSDAARFLADGARVLRQLRPVSVEGRGLRVRVPAPVARATAGRLLDALAAMAAGDRAPGGGPA